jgi:hypothetical protein
MKNFSVTIDLGKFDCCAIRQGHSEVAFHFRVLHNGRILEVSTKMEYGFQWVVDRLFAEQDRSALKKAALRSLNVMQQQMLAKDQEVTNLADGEALKVDNPELES